MKLTTHIHLVLRLRMVGAIPHCLHMPSLQAQGQLYLNHVLTVTAISVQLMSVRGTG